MAIRATSFLPLLSVAAAMLGSASAQAQAVSGVVNVKLIGPNTISETKQLDFGTILRPTAAGTLTMQAQTGVLTPSASITLAGGTPQRGQFVGYGTPLALVVITSSASITLTRSGGTETMTINTLRKSVNGGAQINVPGVVTLSTGGDFTMDIGGRLNVGANQAEGTYNGTYTVTANYL